MQTATFNCVVDLEADALYLYASDPQYSQTPIPLRGPDPMDPGINVDYYSDGTLLGIEMLFYRDYLSQDSPVMEVTEGTGDVVLRRKDGRIYFDGSSEGELQAAERLRLSSGRSDVEGWLAFDAAGTLLWVDLPPQITF